MGRLRWPATSEMKSGNYWWVVIRVGLILAGLIQSPSLLTSMGTEYSQSSWTFPLKMIPLCAGSLFFVIGLQARRVRLTEDKWQRPSWFQNPFSFRQPLQLFDASSYSFLATAVGCAVLGLSRSPTSWAWEMFFSIGAGLWIGVRLCVQVFDDSFEPALKSN